MRNHLPELSRIMHMHTPGVGYPVPAWQLGFLGSGREIIADLQTYPEKEPQNFRWFLI